VSDPTHPLPDTPATAPAFSVVLPFFDAAEHLALTLATVREQSLSDWELIGVDDGCRDDSADLFLRETAGDPRVRLLRQENAGVSVARNRGVAASRAALIAFLDADDLWHPDKLAIHQQAHRDDPTLGVSFAAVSFLSAAGTPSGRRASRPRRPLRPADLLYENPTTTTSNWVVRRELFEQVGGFVTGMNHAEDLEWLLRVACRTDWRIGALTPVLTYYRTSSGGLSSGLERMERGWLQLVREARNYAPDLVDRHFAAARAVQLRYLARRSLRLRGPASQGLDYMARCLASDWTLLLREPRRTGLTALAVTARWLAGIGRRPPAGGAEAAARAGGEAAEAKAAQAEGGAEAQEQAGPDAGGGGEAQPLVSVVVPLYNSARTVIASLESVLGQTYRNLEILVVDDGSTDDGVELCRALADPRIRIVQQKNRGLAGARNTGIRHASGAILAFLDSDDLWLPGKIAAHVAHLRARPEVGVSFSRSALIDEAGRPLGLYQTPSLVGITPAKILCRNPISNGSCVVLRREVLDGIRFRADLYGTPEDYWFDDSFRQSEDIECWLRIALQTDWTIEGIPEPLTLYRVNSGGLSANIEKQFASWQRVIDKTATYAPELIARWGRRARAYQLRYLARRAIRERQPRMGARLATRAVRSDPGLLLEEPLRTLITLAAGWLGVLLPPPVYGALERWMMGLTGRLQRLRIQRQTRHGAG
jgi:glycosyltransferase involved in cell wall biosynthesis